MKTKKTPSADAMILRLADLCARSEQCEYDLRAKIGREGLGSADADKIIARLRSDRYIDDRRFARAFTNDKLRFSAWGRYKIKLHLALKKIPSDYIDEALAEIPERDYYEAALRTASQKARTLDLTTKDDNAKLFRHLVSRGFETALAIKICKTLRHKQTE